MKNYFWILMLLASFTANQKEKPLNQPNIILFMVDDMGWQDTSVPFWTQTTALNRIYKTPNMERLAAQGMKFTQAYASSICSPTRVSLMTGMNAAHHRVTNWTLNKNELEDGQDDRLTPPDWNYNGLSPVDSINNSIYATSLPSVLQTAGYQTIHVGKAHFAANQTPCAEPLNCGFDVNIAGHAAGAPGSYQGLENFGNNEDGSPNPPWSVPGLEKYHGQDINLTEVLTLEAIDAIDRVQQTGDPFFLYMAHYAVHIPIEADSRFYQYYLNQGLDTIEAKYASMVEAMDKSLGDLMDHIEKIDEHDNTIILFMSDNGGLSAVGRGGTPHTHNLPLSSGKGSAHEGGIREPMIVKWPGVVKENVSCDDYLIIEDFFPTILEMAGVNQVSIPQEIDGISFIPLLTKEQNDDPQVRPLFWHVPNIWGPSGPGIGSSSAVRKGKWKLIYYHKDRSFELFNLDEDIGEQNNLVATEKDMVNDLSIILGEYLRSKNAQMPFDKLLNRPVEFPDQL